MPAVEDMLKKVDDLVPLVGVGIHMYACVLVKCMHIRQGGIRSTLFFRVDYTPAFEPAITNALTHASAHSLTHGYTRVYVHVHTPSHSV